MSDETGRWQTDFDSQDSLIGIRFLNDINPFVKKNYHKKALHKNMFSKCKAIFISHIFFHVRINH